MHMRYLCGTALALLAATAQPVFAADAAASDGTETKDLVGNEIIVTASKREQRLIDVPASIVAVTDVDLRRRGATELRDILANTAGVNNPSAGARSLANITIRGVTTGTATGIRQNTVQQLYDDIPLDPTANAGTTNLRLIDVERVEVLRGPQGTLFGSGSLAGALRYVTRKPDVDTASGRIEGSVSFTKDGGTNGSGQATVNIPLIPGKLALRASGYAFGDAGWVDNQRTGRKDENGSETYGGRATLHWQATETFQADLSWLYQSINDKATGGSNYDGPDHDQVTLGRVDTAFRGRNSIVGLNLKYDAGSFTVTSQSTYHDRKLRYISQNGYYFPLVTGILSGFQNVQEGYSSDISPNNGKIFTQELRIASSGTGPFKWTVGGFYLDADITAGQFARSPDLVPILGGDNVVDLNIKGRQIEYAGFGEATYTLGDKIDLSAGVRVSRVTLRNDVRTGGFLPVFSLDQAAYVNQTFNQRNTPVTPHFSITWRPTQDLSLYAAAARGYRVGGINVTSGVGGRNTPRTYGSDSLWNYEVGIKGRLFDGRLDFALAGYYIDWKDIQVSLVNNIGNYTGNAGRAHLYGVEFEGTARLTDHFTLGAAFNFSSNEIAQRTEGLGTAAGVVTVVPGDKLAASPESQANGFAEYRFDLGKAQVYARIAARYVGPAYTAFNRAGARFGDYGAADLRIGADFGRFEVVGFINNLTDSAGKTSAGDATFAGPVLLNEKVAFRLQPRTIGLTVRANF